MPCVRLRSLRRPLLIVVLGMGFTLTHIFLPASAVPWHLDLHCSTCLRIDEPWKQYGKGHSDIAVVVAEKDIFADTRSAASWHPGLSLRFELVLGSHAPVILDPHPPLC